MTGNDSLYTHALLPFFGPTSPHHPALALRLLLASPALALAHIESGNDEAGTERQGQGQGLGKGSTNLPPPCGALLPRFNRRPPCPPWDTRLAPKCNGWM